MATWRHINNLKNDDILRVVKEDFKWSERMREEINRANLINLKTFHAIDLDQPLDVAPAVSRDNNNMAATFAMFSAQESSGNAFYPPIARGLILAYWALISTSLFPANEHWLNIMANEQFDERAAEAFEQVARYLYREIDYSSEADLAILQALNLDLSLIYTGWKIEPGTIQIMDKQFTKIWNPENNEYVKTNDYKHRMRFEYVPNARSLPDYWSVNTFNVRHDPDATHGDLEKSNPLFIGITAKMNKAEFYRRAEAQMYSECEWTSTKKGGSLKIGGKKFSDDEPCGGDDGDTTADYQQIIDNDLKIRTSDSGEMPVESEIDENGSGNTNHIRVSYYWQRYSHTIVVNDKHVIHKQETLGWPFQKLVSYPIQGRFSGRPIMTDLIQIQHDITTMARSRRNRQDEQAYPITLVDQSQFDSRDDAMAVYDGSGDVKIYNSTRNPDNRNGPVTIIERNVNFDDTVREQEIEKDMGQWVTGFDEGRMAAPTSGVRESATKTTATSRGGAIRTGWIIRRFAKGVIERPTYTLYTLAHRFVTRPFRFRVAGVRGGVSYASYEPSDFAMRTPPEIRAVTTLQKQDMMADAQMFMNALTMAVSNPLMAQLVKLAPATHELFRRMGVENTDEYLHSDKPLDINVPPKYEISLLIHSVDVPLMNQVDAEEHFNAISEFINSVEFDKISPEAQQRIARRGEEYKKIIDMGGQMPPGMNMGGGQAQMAGGMMGGGGPMNTEVNGQVNRMAGGTSPNQVAAGGA